MILVKQRHRNETKFSGVQGLENRRREIVDGIRMASEDWGIFQIVNHGVPIEVMEAMKEGVRGFHEQPVEEKKGLYSSDSSQRVRFSSNVAMRELVGGIC